MKKVLFTLLFILVFTFSGYSQVFSFNETISMEVVSVKLRKSAFGGAGIIPSRKGEKLLELKITFYSNSNKREKINCWRMVFKFDGKEIISQRDPGLVATEEKDFYFKFRKKVTRKLFTDVPDTFTHGELYYYGKLLGTIKVKQGEKGGEFIPSFE